jgi:L-iditol 2-dehydrogenase
MKMRAAFLTGIRSIVIEETEAPRIVSETDVLLRVLSVGVCGSDVHYYNEGRIGDQVVSYPFVVGHEMTGLVVETGRGVTRVRRGERVAVDPAISCHACRQCALGRYHTCSSLLFLGCPGQKAGCLSDLIVMPEESCFALPETLSDDEGALCEPLSIGAYAVKLADTKKAGPIGILGSGPIGLSVLLSLIDQGGHTIYTTDIIDNRCSAASALGADWSGNPCIEDVVQKIRGKEKDGLSLVFECSGKQEALDQAVRLLAPGGKVMIVGIPDFDSWSVSAHIARRFELGFQNVRRQNQCMEEAIRLAAEHRDKLSVMLTHRFTLDDTKKAFDLVSTYSDNVIKATVHPG